MKKILLFICLSVLIISCENKPRTEYEVTITYTLHGSNNGEKWEYTTEHIDTIQMSSDCNPVYSVNENGTSLIIKPDINKWGQEIMVYRGFTPVIVKSFSYKVIRKYEISGLNGREIEQ